MVAWEVIRVAALFDCEAARLVAALETLESIDEHARCVRGELEQAHLGLREK